MKTWVKVRFRIKVWVRHVAFVVGAVSVSRCQVLYADGSTAVNAWSILHVHTVLLTCESRSGTR